jgi:hypothetical protein
MSSRPLSQGHTTSHPPSTHELDQHVHMEHLTWTLYHDSSQGLMRGGYHLAMPAWSTTQILLVLQLGQSLDQIEPTQARQQVKTQVTQPPMQLPKLDWNTRNQAPRRTYRLRKNCTKKIWPSGTIVQTRSPRESSTREALILKWTSKP